MKVAVFGLGYVGTVSAAVLASRDHEVWGVDVDVTKVKLVARGKSPVVEPGLDALVRSAVQRGALHATSVPRRAVEGASVSIICVGTPSSPTGKAELGYLRRATSDIAAVLGTSRADTFPEGRHALLVRSTVPPGTMEELVDPLMAEASDRAGVAIGTGMCPEFLREGSAIADCLGSPLAVVGTRERWVAAVVRRLFDFLPVRVQMVPPREAEALKYACNAFHATKIAFANEIGRIFRLLGVDARRVMELLCEDTKLNISGAYLAPGFAFGGSCLPKDLRSLLYFARTNFVDLPLLAGVVASNQLSVSEVVSRVLATEARRVAILGLSFKAGSDDLRESPYVDLAEILIGKGLDVRIYDPIVDPSQLVGANRRHIVSKLPHVRRTLRPSATEALRDVDLALVSCSDREVADALVHVRPVHVIDLNGRLNHDVEELPHYEGAAW